MLNLHEIELVYGMHTVVALCISLYFCVKMNVSACLDLEYSDD